MLKTLKDTKTNPVYTATCTACIQNSVIFSRGGMALTKDKICWQMHKNSCMLEYYLEFELYTVYKIEFESTFGITCLYCHT